MRYRQDGRKWLPPRDDNAPPRRRVPHGRCKCSDMCMMLLANWAWLRMEDETHISVIMALKVFPSFQRFEYFTNNPDAEEVPAEACPPVAYSTMHSWLRQLGYRNKRVQKREKSTRRVTYPLECDWVRKVLSLWHPNRQWCLDEFAIYHGEVPKMTLGRIGLRRTIRAKHSYSRSSGLVNVRGDGETYWRVLHSHKKSKLSTNARQARLGRGVNCKAPAGYKCVCGHDGRRNEDDEIVRQGKNVNGWHECHFLSFLKEMKSRDLYQRGDIQVMDLLGVHLTEEVRRWLFTEGVTPFYLPAKTSHEVSWLDNGVFSPLRGGITVFFE